MITDSKERPADSKNEIDLIGYGQFYKWEWKKNAVCVNLWMHPISLIQSKLFIISMLNELRIAFLGFPAISLLQLLLQNSDKVLVTIAVRVFLEAVIHGHSAPQSSSSAAFLMEALTILESTDSRLGTLLMTCGAFFSQSVSPP